MQPFVKLRTIEISQYWLIPITDPIIGATLIVTAKVQTWCLWCFASFADDRVSMHV